MSIFDFVTLFLAFSSEGDLFPIFFDSILSISHSQYGVT